MAYNFFIKQNSTLPSLQMEFIDNGKNDVKLLNTALLSSTIYFTMTNIENGVKHISNAPAEIIPNNTDGCSEKYIIEYKWKNRDTKSCGLYKGQFKIVFPQDINIDNTIIPEGILIAPISQDLLIHII